MKHLTSLKDTLAGLEPAKRAGMAVAVLAVLLLLGWVATRSGEPMGLLYSGLDPAEAGRIDQRLDELKVPFQNRGDGTTIMVPASQVGRLRMDLAAAGMPRMAGAGYELLDTQSPMSMTSFMQRVQRLRALEGELARTISTLDGVKAARVHVVLPERESFARDTPKPTASIAVTMLGPMRLEPRQAMAIRLLVAGAVPGLRQDDVSVLDSAGVVLAANGAEVMETSRLEEMKASREQALQHAVTELLEPLVGAGRMKTIVSVDVDGTREVSHEEKFDPLSQVERSRHTQHDIDATAEASTHEPVSVSQNVPGQAQGDDAPPEKNTSSNTHNGETVNYELSSVRSERVREPGDLKRMTVAVVVDGTTDSNGTYHPRPPEELERIAALVRSAVGFDAKRGDTLTVDTMRFLPPTAALGETGEEAPAGANSWMMPAAGALAVLLIAGGAVFVLRGRRGSAAGHQNAALIMAQNGIPGQEAIAAPGGSGQLMLTSEQSGAVAKLNGVFDSQPEEALALIRAWIAEGAPA